MEWISVKDRLPEEYVKVLTIDILHYDPPNYKIDHIIHIREDDTYQEQYIWGCRLYDEQNDVSHWMPLPEPPEEKLMDQWPESNPKSRESGKG